MDRAVWDSIDASGHWIAALLMFIRVVGLVN
jgi:hypothetical protein